MRGRMPFPDPVLPIAIVAMMVAVIFPLVQKSCNPDKDGGDIDVAMPDHATTEEVHEYLKNEGVIDAESKIVSTEWNENEKHWLVITEQGKYEDGQIRYGHWFVDAQAKEWSGSTCRH